MATRASAGHKLGQLIGDWFEQHFVLPLLMKVGHELNLFVDCRFTPRPARGDRILWQDADKNSVDYDFVLELQGTTEEIGIPVAFIESFWRRGARHSKDKARDDTGKLLPMRAVYPTARFLGIVAAGDFTAPARELVRSRDIDLFYVTKDKIVSAFAHHGLTIDYHDQSGERQKQQIARAFERNFSDETRLAVAQTLVELLSRAAVDSYVDRVRARLSALPQEIRFIQQMQSTPAVFHSPAEADVFLQNPTFGKQGEISSYLYQVLYSDGTEFEQQAADLAELRLLQNQVSSLAKHMNALSKTIA